ncbi:MAG: prenyltransferase [Bacteroidales bacterium]
MSNNANHTFKDFILAVRPWSFPASSMTAVVTFSYIFYIYKTNTQYQDINWIYGLLAIIGAVLSQAAGNLISDYFDFKKGVDIKETHGTNRMLIDGIFKPKSFLRAGFILLFIISLIGIYLVLNTGIELLWIGLIGIFCAIFYYWFKYHALGDFTIFIIYGPIIALGTAFVMTGYIDLNALYISLPIAFLVVNILHANNTHDISNDKRAKIKTVPILLGFKISQNLYLINDILAYVLTTILIITKILPIWSLLILITLFIAVKNIKTMFKATEKNEDILEGLDGASAKLVLLFDFVLVVSLIIAAYV